MTGALGNFFIGERMFKVVLQLSREMENNALELDCNSSQGS